MSVQTISTGPQAAAKMSARTRDRLLSIISPLALLTLWELCARFGFIDAFNEEKDWFAETYLSIDQGPIVAMLENHRSELIWSVMRRNPYIRDGLRRAGFEGGWIDAV